MKTKVLDILVSAVASQIELLVVLRINFNKKRTWNNSKCKCYFPVALSRLREGFSVRLFVLTVLIQGLSNQEKLLQSCSHTCEDSENQGPDTCGEMKLT